MRDSTATLDFYEIIQMDFKKRFLENLPIIPSHLDLGLDEFVEYDKTTLNELDKEDSQLLIKYGMPKGAPPFLNFMSHSNISILELHNSSILPTSYFPFGFNGSGDVIAIDTVSKEIVYFNHDSHNARILINTSLIKFAESLCIYLSCQTNIKMNKCAPMISKLDPPAIKVGTMWHSELQP